MESFINRIKSTVSEVLPGNPLSGDYEIPDEVIGSAGPQLCWKIYRAHKKSTKEAASVFVFEKKMIDKMSRDDKKLIIASLRRGVQQLTKLRHPKILSVVHPIEENRDCLAFATEPVMMSLTNAIDPESPSKIQLDEVEIKYGLLQILEGLSFLHNDAKLVHGSLHPSSILINDKKIWKLSGFDFYIPNSSTSPNNAQYDYKEWHSSMPPYTQPDLDYVAPECGIRGYCDTKSDLFSLGVTIHAVYNQGKPAFQSHNSVASFKQHASEMRKFRQSLLRNIPSGFHGSYRGLMSYEPSERPEAKALSKNVYFEDIAVMTIVYLDTLVQRDNLQRSEFFKSLPNVIRQLPHSICIYRVLPALFSECSNRDMIPFVLQNILIIADICSKQEYREHIFPKLKPILPLSQPIQIPLLLLKNMTLLLKQTDERETKAHILPMLFTSIELNNSQLQELCLDILPSFSYLIEKQSMKTSVIPRVKKLCIATQYLNLRVKCLVSIGKMVTHMDKWFVLDEVLPFLPQIPSREPAILMAILGIYKIVFTNKDLGIPKEQIATKSLPFLLPLSADHSLSKQQFISYMSVVKEMLSTYEAENMSRLTELEKKEQGDTTSSSLGFTGQDSASDNVMKGFLSEAGLVSGGATQVSSCKPMMASAAASKSSPVFPQPINPAPTPKVRDLTSTLGSTSIQPIKPPQPVSAPIRPTIQPTLANLNGGSTVNKTSPMSSMPQRSTRPQMSSPMNSMLQPMTPSNNANSRTMAARPLNQLTNSNSQQNMMSMNMNSTLTPMQPMQMNSSPSKAPSSLGSGMTSSQSNTGWSIAPPPQATPPSQLNSANSGWSFQSNNPPVPQQQNWMSGNMSGAINQSMPSMPSQMPWPNNMNSLNQPSKPNQNSNQLSQNDINNFLI